MSVQEANNNSDQVKEITKVGLVLIVLVTLTYAFNNIYAILAGLIACLIFSVVMAFIAIHVEKKRFDILVKSIREGRRECLRLLAKK